MPQTPSTGQGSAFNRQRSRLEALFTRDDHIGVEATWGIYQRIVAAYRKPDKNKGKQMMRAVITAVSADVPAALVEIRRP